MPSGPRKRKAQRRKKEEREKELEKEKEKDKEEVKEKLSSPTTSSSSQDFNHSKKDIHYNEESSKDDTGSSSSSSSSSGSSGSSGSGSEEDGEKKKGAADGSEDEAAVGEVKVAEEIKTAIAIAIEKRVVPPAGDGAEAVPDEGADKPFDVLIERDDKLSHEGAERAVLSDPSDCPAGESIREEEELCCRESEETEAAPAPLLEHRTAWWNCCGMLDVFAGSKND